MKNLSLVFISKHSIRLGVPLPLAFLFLMVRVSDLLASSITSDQWFIGKVVATEKFRVVTNTIGRCEIWKAKVKVVNVEQVANYVPPVTMFSHVCEVY